MHLPEDQARTEIASLTDYFVKQGPLPESTGAVLRACTSCFTCNLVCPNNCRPANLFLDIWYRQYKQEGLPARARYFLPHSVPNFRTHVLDSLSREEKAALESWKGLDPVAEIFYPGCNIITAPYLTFSRLFEGIAVRGALEYCCGEMYFRMGLYDQVEQAARKCTRYFRTLRVGKVYLLCTAGLNLFTNVLPQFGADFTGIEFIPLLKRLYVRLESGELKTVQRFDGKTITVQDSCHAHVFEEDYGDWPRKILQRLGFRIVEAPQHEEGMVCCGIGGGFSHGAAYGKSDLIGGQRRCIRNADAAGADYIGVYCAGCLEMLSVAKYVSWSRTPVYHIIELLQEAIGETPARKHRKLAFQFLKGVLLHQERGTERFFVPPIP
jgi:Fe-S oxidoreductase